MEPYNKHTMISNKKPSNLPVPLNLPEPVTLEPEQEQAPAKYSPWHNYASQQHVRDVAIGPDGYVWLATAGGVLRWTPDMACFTRYTSEHGLPGNAIMAIAVDGCGQVWAVNQRRQLSYLDEESWHLYEWLDDPVHCMSVDQAGRLWLATPRGVMAIDQPKSPLSQELIAPARLSWPKSRTLPPARALAVGDKGDIWLCNAIGVYHHDGNKWQPPREIRGVLTLARQGSNLWLGTGNGLLRIVSPPALGGKKANEKSSSDSWPRGHVTALLPTTNGVSTKGVWAAIGGQVGLATESKWDGLPKRFDAHITRLASTSDDELLIATHAGLASGGPYAIDWYHTESPPEAISCASKAQRTNSFSNMVQALAVNARHAFPSSLGTCLWIGTARGLFRLDLAEANDTRTEEESWWSYPRPHLQDVRALAVGVNDNNPWIASWDEGCKRLRKQIIGQKTRPPAIPSSLGTCLSLTMGTGAECWAAVALDVGASLDASTAQADGLYHYDGSSWSLALSASKLRAEKVLPKGAWIQTVAAAPNGPFWLGTSVGLFRYDRTSDEVEAVNTTLGMIRALLLLPDETLCVASTQGLYLGKPPHLNPVPDMAVGATALAWDENVQTLWVGTDSGLMGFSEHNWTIFDTFNIHNSGLGANFVTALALHISEGGQKQLWIGTPCGLSRYCY